MATPAAVRLLARQRRHHIEVRLMPKQHSLDRVADELEAWVEEMSEYLVEAFLEDGAAPFEAKVTEQQRLDYFTNLLFTPDGAPNVEGRQHVLESVGGDIDEYVRTFRWVETRRNRELRGTSKREPAKAPTAARDGGDRDSDDKSEEY